MKVRAVIKQIEQDGWRIIRIRRVAVGKVEHPGKPGLVTVPGNSGDDLAPGTLNSILKQSWLKE